MLIAGNELTAIVVVAVEEQLLVPFTVTVYVPAELVVAGVTVVFCETLEKPFGPDHK
jgi:hypothetical protein